MRSPEHFRPALALCAALVSTACDEVPDGPVVGGQGVPLSVPVGADGAFVDLDGPGLSTAGDAWELHFSGKDVFTNGGVSGQAMGSAFGPLDVATFGSDLVPAEVPFMIDDFSGGPFVDWWVYDPGAHVIYSRFHVFGVRRGSEHYKMQLISFYGEQQGAPVSGLYRFRTARVSESGAEPTELYDEFDGTAGGASPQPSSPSGCLSLATGERLELTPSEALASDAWDLCFRRDTVSVNGGEGGLGNVEAVDLDQGESSGETLAEVMQRSEASEQARFDQVDYAALTDETLAYRADGVLSAFSDFWLVPQSSPLAPAEFVWLVAGSDGVTPFLVAFDSFDGPSDDDPGTVNLRVKKIQGGLP